MHNDAIIPGCTGDWISLIELSWYLALSDRGAKPESVEELSLGSRGCCWGSASAMGRARGGSARHPTSPTVPHRTASLCRALVQLDRSELAGFSGWIRASGGMAAGGFPSGRHSIMTERTSSERTPLFGYVRSKPLIPREWPADTRTLLPQFPLGWGCAGAL